LHYFVATAEALRQRLQQTKYAGKQKCQEVHGAANCKKGFRVKNNERRVRAMVDKLSSIGKRSGGGLMGAKHLNAGIFE